MLYVHLHLRRGQRERSKRFSSALIAPEIAANPLRFSEDKLRSSEIAANKGEAEIDDAVIQRYWLWNTVVYWLWNIFVQRHRLWNIVFQRHWLWNTIV